MKTPMAKGAKCGFGRLSDGARAQPVAERRRLADLVMALGENEKLGYGWPNLWPLPMNATAGRP